MVGGVLGSRARRDLRAGGMGWFVLVVAAVVVIVATVGLARGEAATMAAGEGRDLKISDRPRRRRNA